MCCRRQLELGRAIKPPPAGVALHGRQLLELRSDQAQRNRRLDAVAQRFLDRPQRHAEQRLGLLAIADRVRPCPTIYRLR